jgi:hypothetical protein
MVRIFRNPARGRARPSARWSRFVAFVACVACIAAAQAGCGERAGAGEAVGLEPTPFIPEPAADEREKPPNGPPPGCDPKAPEVFQPWHPGEPRATVQLPRVDGAAPGGFCVRDGATHAGDFHLSVKRQTHFRVRVLDRETGAPVPAKIGVGSTCVGAPFDCVDTEVRWMDQKLFAGEWLLGVSAKAEADAASNPIVEITVLTEPECDASEFETLQLGEEMTGEVTAEKADRPLWCGRGGGPAQSDPLVVTLDAPTRVIAEIPWADFDPILEVARTGCPVAFDVLACQDDVVPNEQPLPRIGPLVLPAGTTTFRVGSADGSRGAFGLLVRPETETMPAACRVSNLRALLADAADHRESVRHFRGAQIVQPTCFGEDDGVAALYRLEVDRPTAFEVRGDRRVRAVAATTPMAASTPVPGGITEALKETQPDNFGNGAEFTPAKRS